MLKFSFVWNFYDKICVEFSLVISGTAKQDCMILLYRLVLLYWSRIINNFLSLFWRYISFIRYFFIMFICFSIVSQLLSCKCFETKVILLLDLLPMKVPVASTVFWIALFEVVLSVSVAVCLAWSRSFWLYLPLSFDLYFYKYLYPYF